MDTREQSGDAKGIHRIQRQSTCGREQLVIPLQALYLRFIERRQIFGFIRTTQYLSLWLYAHIMPYISLWTRMVTSILKPGLKDCRRRIFRVANQISRSNTIGFFKVYVNRLNTIDELKCIIRTEFSSTKADTLTNVLQELKHHLISGNYGYVT